MILWGETLSKPQMKISQRDLLRWVYGGRETHCSGRINRALVGLQLASCSSRWAGFGPRASIRPPCSCLPLAPSFWQLEGAAPLLSPPRAMPGSCARAARSPAPLSLPEILIYGKGGEQQCGDGQ